MKKRFIPIFLVIVMLFGLMPTAAMADSDEYVELTYTDELVEYIKKGEGFRSFAYADGTGWYIGYGVACGKDEFPDGISEEKGEELLREKMDLFAGEVNNFARKNGVTLTQGQFDAMVSFKSVQ